MMLDLDWIRRELLFAIGLVACSADDGGLGSAGSGDGSSGDATEADGSSAGTTDASTSVTTIGSTTAPPGWPDPPWCGVAPPDDATPPRPCDDPQSLVQTNTEVASGWISCLGSGGMHRESVVACVIPEGSVGSCNPETAEMPECTADADCDAAPNGYCDSMLEGMFGPETCSCVYACESDSDCNEGETCFCAGAASRCITSHCITDADCGEGFHCWINGNVIACDTPFDTCATSQDCTVGDCPYCEYQADLCASQCVEAPACTAGRPFLVRGAARRASLVAGATTTSHDGDLDDDTRRLLAQYWADCGLAEHASVAAFARFALQLMALGAPADLLADTARAMSDEVEHARLCFALAMRYAGVAIEAGPLATSDALAGSHDLVSVAELVAKEACVAETLAAIEAAEALARADDPQVTAALQRIAADELRHAALGWRFLAWALARTDAAGRTRIRTALRDAIASSTPPVVAASPRARSIEHGLLPAAVRHELARRALCDVVSPLATALA